MNFNFEILANIVTIFLEKKNLAVMHIIPTSFALAKY